MLYNSTINVLGQRTLKTMQQFFKINYEFSREESITIINYCPRFLYLYRKIEQQTTYSSNFKAIKYIFIDIEYSLVLDFNSYSLFFSSFCNSLALHVRALHTSH